MKGKGELSAKIVMITIEAEQVIKG